MSGRIHAIINENGKQVEAARLSTRSDAFGAAHVNSGAHSHDEFQVLEFVGNFIEYGMEEIPERLEALQRKSLIAHGNRYSWMYALIGLIVALFMLFFLVSRISARWRNFQRIKDAERQREAREQKIKKPF
jgi:hypothetical protein